MLNTFYRKVFHIVMHIVAQNMLLKGSARTIVSALMSRKAHTMQFDAGTVHGKNTPN